MATAQKHNMHKHSDDHSINIYDTLPLSTAAEQSSHFDPVGRGLCPRCANFLVVFCSLIVSYMTALIQLVFAGWCVISVMPAMSSLSLLLTWFLSMSAVCALLSLWLFINFCKRASWSWYIYVAFLPVVFFGLLFVSVFGGVLVFVMLITRMPKSKWSIDTQFEYDIVSFVADGTNYQDQIRRVFIVNLYNEYRGKYELVQRTHPFVDDQTMDPFNLFDGKRTKIRLVLSDIVNPHALSTICAFFAISAPLTVLVVYDAFLKHDPKHFELQAIGYPIFMFFIQLVMMVASKLCISRRNERYFLLPTEYFKAQLKRDEDFVCNVLPARRRSDLALLYLNMQRRLQAIEQIKRYCNGNDIVMNVIIDYLSDLHWQQLVRT